MHISPYQPKHSTAVAIFARRPIPGKTKTRLIPLLGRVGAAEFQAALIEDVIRKVQALNRRAGRPAAYLFLPGSPAALPHDLLHLAILPQRGRGLGERLDAAFRLLLSQHAAAVVIGTDSPLLTPGALRLALDELKVCDAVLGPCPDGGYYLVGLRAGSDQDMRTLGRRGVFARVRWGSAFAFGDTLRNLVRSGLSCSVLEPLGDVDRPRDWRRLARELASQPAARRLAPATWRFVKGIGSPLPRRIR